MHPAISIVLFTVLSGIGFGLVAVSPILHAFGHASFDAFVASISIGLALVAIGLCSSVFHLARPGNAWRAVMRFRTSWLSREAVLSTLFFPCAIATTLIDLPQYPLIVMFLVILALVCVVSTAMIYASLKTIPNWHHPLTVINYLTMALMSGLALGVATILSIDGIDQIWLFALLAVVTIVATVAKIAYYARIGKTRPITAGEATGFTMARVKLFDKGHSGPNFLTREFVFEKSADQLTRLRVISLLASFVVPFAIFVIIALLSRYFWMTFIGCLSMFVGLLIERWLFFAEAQHVVRLYHGAKSV